MLPPANALRAWNQSACRLCLALMLALVTTAARTTPGSGLASAAQDDSAPSIATTAASEPLDLPGRVIGDLNLRTAPIVREDTLIHPLPHNTPVWVHDRLVGDDGSVWYRVDDSAYLLASEVRLPLPPPEVFTGRWLDVELTSPALITAYEDDQPVFAALAIKGRGADATPDGMHEIIRRVYDETMDSATLGVPRSSADGYFLEHVLYTQYFTEDGSSLHFNYWSSDFGEEGSHGCLGLSLEDATWLWDWADVGTLINIHG